MIELPLPPGVERQVVDTPAGPVATLTAKAVTAKAVTGTAVTGTADTSQAPTVVMVSGFFGTKEDFREVLPIVAEAGYDGWAYDYPGQLGTRAGDSASSYAIPAMAAQLHQLIQTVSPGQPAHVVGHCLGGFVARHAVLGEPALARSLTLLCCGPSMREAKHKVMLGGLKSMQKNGGTLTLWPIVKRLLAEDDTVVREFWHAKLSTMNPHFVAGAAHSMGEETDRTEELNSAGIPSLVVHGKRDKRLWGPHAYQDMASRLNAALIVIDKAAHSPNMEQPEPTARALLDFWGPA
ncbi:MAG TPA: alpha/beta hydrolase [Streptosporangiaceae bacterium]